MNSYNSCTNYLFKNKNVLYIGNERFYVQIKPNKYDCPVCGRKGIYKDKNRYELCMKCKIVMKRSGGFS